MSDLRARTIIPIFGVGLKLSIVSDARKECIRMFGKEGADVLSEDAQACAVRSGPEFAILVKESYASSDIIAHEIHHATNMILDHHGIKLDPDNDEIGALLTQYIHKWVWKQIEKNQPLDKKKKRAKLAK